MNVCKSCGMSFEQGLFCPWCGAKYSGASYDELNEVTLGSYDDRGDEEPFPARRSEGLLFKDAGAECSVRGVGVCTDSDIYIPAKHRGRPVTAIDAWAFHNFRNVAGVTVPVGVRKIGPFAFFGCGSLSRITIPDSVLEIGNSAFDGCTALSSVFFRGGREAWEHVTVGAYNDAVAEASIYFYSESEPAESGNFWHYSDDKAEVWKTEN